MKYYHLLLKVKPYMCNSFTQNVVLSEHPLKWWSRQDNRKNYEAELDILQYSEIPLDLYLLRRPKNPRRPGKTTSTLASMNARDWGQ